LGGRSRLLHFQYGGWFGLLGQSQWAQRHGSELFDRRDISQASTPIDHMANAVQRIDLKSWDNDVTSQYTDLSLGVISDVAYQERTHLSWVVAWTTYRPSSRE